MNEELLCLDCSRPLADATTNDATHCVKCECGVRYSVELLQGITDVDVEKWNHIRKERLFIRDGADSLTIFDPPEVTPTFSSSSSDVGIVY